MKPANPRILTINGGSSSIKFALYLIGGPLARTLAGKIDRIGLPGANLTFSDTPQGQQNSQGVVASDHLSAANFLIDWLDQHVGLTHVMAVGHRVVHGMQHTEPERVSQALLDELHCISSYDPNHLPHEIALIEAFRQRYPQLPQVACFDTAFTTPCRAWPGSCRFRVVSIPSGSGATDFMACPMLISCRN